MGSETISSSIELCSIKELPLRSRDTARYLGRLALFQRVHQAFGLATVSSQTPTPSYGAVTICVTSHVRALGVTPRWARSFGTPCKPIAHYDRFEITAKHVLYYTCGCPRRAHKHSIVPVSYTLPL